jgi:hypothetical protein
LKHHRRRLCPQASVAERPFCAPACAAISERTLPIRTYLAGRTFDPELIQQMSAAFQGVCTALNLRPIDDAITRLVAEKIIELAVGGTHSQALLHLMTLEKFRSNTSTQTAATPQPALPDGSELIEPIPLRSLRGSRLLGADHGDANVPMPGVRASHGALRSLGRRRRL